MTQTSQSERSCTSRVDQKPEGLRAQILGSIAYYTAHPAHRSPGLHVQGRGFPSAMMRAACMVREAGRQKKLQAMDKCRRRPAMTPGRVGAMVPSIAPNTTTRCVCRIETSASKPRVGVRKHRGPGTDEGIRPGCGLLAPPALVDLAFHLLGTLGLPMIDLGFAARGDGDNVTAAVVDALV